MCRSGSRHNTHAECHRQARPRRARTITSSACAAATRAGSLSHMTERNASKLSESPVQLPPDGTAKVVPGQGYSVDAWQAGKVLMTESSRHGGERHLDCDELFWLISGSARMSLARDDASPEVVQLSPGRGLCCSIAPLLRSPVGCCSLAPAEPRVDLQADLHSNASGSAL